MFGSLFFIANGCDTKRGTNISPSLANIFFRIIFFSKESNLKKLLLCKGGKTKCG